jgi:antitoxin component YwqK of YwqJK toxin-antitoxin module
MKIIVILGLVLLVSCAQEPEVVAGHLLIRDGITYLQDTNEPFTGTVENYYDDGQLSLRRHFIDGKPDGVTEAFYENGQLAARANHKDGKPFGVSEIFDKDGNLTETRTFRNGVPVELN